MPKYTITVASLEEVCEIEEALKIRRRNIADAAAASVGLAIGEGAAKKLARIDAVLTAVDNADEIG